MKDFQSRWNRKCSPEFFHNMLLSLREIKNGLHSIWVFRCAMCDKEMRVRSHSESNNGLNAQCVWGTLVAGMGFSQAEEFMSTVGVPFMSEPKFRKEEELVGKVSSSCST